MPARVPGLAHPSAGSVRCALAHPVNQVEPTLQLRKLELGCLAKVNQLVEGLPADFGTSLTCQTSPRRGVWDPQATTPVQTVPTIALLISYLSLEANS